MASSGILSHGTGVSLAITALAGGAAPSAAANTLAYGVNSVTVVASDNDSVILPAGVPQFGVVWVFNQDTGQDVRIYPNTGATVNGGTATTQFVLMGETIACQCLQVGTDGLTWLIMKGAIAVPA